jgi:CheY-like chemotaxis protein
MNAPNPGSPRRAAGDRNSPLPLDEIVSALVGRRVRDLRLEVGGSGVILRGRASSYHAKQLAQHAILTVTDLPLLANEIEVDDPRPDAPQPDTDVEKGYPVPKARVLLASGDDRLRHAGEAFLTEHNYVVATAADGVECAGLVSALVPDVVVLDTDLLWGGADGVIAHIRARNAARIPVVLLTSGPVPWNEDPMSPVVSVVEKPVVMGALLWVVWSAVGESLDQFGGLNGRGEQGPEPARPDAPGISIPGARLPAPPL